MRVNVKGFGLGEVVDMAMDQQTGALGFAVRMPNGSVDLFPAGLVSVAPGAVNPASVSLPALGSVELQDIGKPDVYALRGQKIPKKKQLSDLLGASVEWDPKGKFGFYLQDTGERLGYSFDEALLTARDLGLWRGSLSDVERLTVEAQKKKWGVLNPALSKEEIEREAREYQRDLAAAYAAIQREEEEREIERELQAAYEAIRLEELERERTENQQVRRRRRLRLTPEQRRALIFSLPVDGRGGQEVQSIMFPRDWDIKEAREWLKGHGFKASLPDVGKTVIRFRQAAPERFDPDTYGVIPFGKSGIQAVVAVPKEGIPSAISKNPWGETTEGERVFYVRRSGPSNEEQLSLFTGQDIQYFFPGESGSPDPSRGGFYLGDRFLGSSWGEAQTEVAGIPWQEIEKQAVRGAVGIIGSRRVAGGSVLELAQRSSDFGSFDDVLSAKDRQALTDDALRAGYSDLEDLYLDMRNLLEIWGRVVNAMDPRFPNPPMSLEVAGPLRRFSASVDTGSGEVIGSEYAGLQGLVVGPDMDYQAALLSDLSIYDQPDFSSVEDAWDQFYNYNIQRVQELYKLPGMGAVGAEMDERDPRGVLFEGVKEYFERKRPIETMEQAVKYTLRKLRIKRWEDFPLWLFQENKDLWWLSLPDDDYLQTVSRGKRGAVPARLAFPQMGKGEVEAELTRSLDFAQERFGLLRTATDMLAYYADKLSSAEFTSLRNHLASIIGADRPFGIDEFTEFRELLEAGKNGEFSDVPF